MSDEAARRRQRALSIGALWAPTRWYVAGAVVGLICGASFAIADSRPDLAGPATAMGFLSLAAGFIVVFFGIRAWLDHIHHDPEWRPAHDAELSPKQRMYAALGLAVPDYIRGSIALVASTWGYDLSDAVRWLYYPAGIAATGLLFLGFWFYYRAVRRYIDGVRGRF